MPAKLKKGILFLNGNYRTADFSAIKTDGKLIIAADGAFDSIKEYFAPDIILGDFDSIRSDIPLKSIVERYPIEKDYTDGHLAVLKARDAGVIDLEIYGGFGGRPDHIYANFSLLALCHSLGIAAVMYGDGFSVRYIDGDFSAQALAGTIVSLEPFTDTVHIKYTKGLKYPLEDKLLDKIHIVGISNSAAGGTFAVSITAGAALLFIERRP